jgi:hypothetical protein
MTGTTLHITNGDSAAAGIREATGQQVLPWRDVLHDGPVPECDDASLRAVRADFIAERHWAAREAVLADLEARDTTVAAAVGRRPIVLWFEPDLYDQLQLLQILDMLARHGAGSDSGLSLIAPAHFLGDHSPPQLTALREMARPLTSSDLEYGVQSWAAFRAPTPERWQAFGFTTSPLPYLTAAVRRHLEEYPDVTTGLARTESQLLTVLANGATKVHSAFLAVQQREEWAYLGDASFVDIVAELATEPYPLLAVGSGLDSALAEHDPRDQPLWNERITLTTNGRAVLAGDQDRIALRGIDRWLGGVHLTDTDVWRWTGEHLTHGG